MASSAVVSITGNLGRDPEVRFTQSGTKSMSFSVATSRKRGGSETTTWWRVTVFGKRVDGLETLSQRGLLAKGSTVSVYGQPELSEWTGNDGAKRTTLEITADDVTFIAAPRGFDESQQQTQYDNNLNAVDF